MCHHYAASGKFQKTRQDFFHRCRIHHHGIIDSRQLLDPERNRDLRIDKFTEPIRNLPFFHLYRTDFDDFIIGGTESCGFNIKYHIAVIERLVL